MLNTEARKLPMEEGKNGAEPVNYTEVAGSPQFKELLARKKAFIVPVTLFFFAFYFTLPLMTSYSKVLNTPVIGTITWAWIFAFAQFIMTWALCMIYTKKAREFDRLVDNIVQQTIKKGGK